MWFGQSVDVTGDGSQDVVIFRRAGPGMGCGALVAFVVIPLLVFTTNSCLKDELAKEEQEREARLQQEETASRAWRRQVQQQAAVEERSREEQAFQRSTARAVASFTDPSQARALVDACNSYIAEHSGLAGRVALENAAEACDYEPESIRSTTVVDEEVIDDLVKYRGWLFLDGLSSLTPEVCVVLADFRGPVIVLDGIQSLSADAAKALAAFPGRAILLNGLSSPTADTARELMRFKGKTMVLNGITEMPRGVAAALATYKGNTLALNGITTFSDEDAEALAKFSGKQLYLEGITSLSKDAITALKSNPGYIGLPRKILER